MNTGVSKGSDLRPRDDVLEHRTDLESGGGQVGDLLDDLPESLRVDIMRALQADEKLLHVERPSWMRSSSFFWLQTD
jgi:hypothetical protein